MIESWYALAGFMLIAYVVLDGRNFGAGMLHWLVARTPQERRQVIAAIGPLWSWHEVWLVGFGGTVLAVFPKLLASAFAGYYLALFLILWCLILRGDNIARGWRGHINDRMWQGVLGFRLRAIASTLLAILFGAAAGNLARGVPLDSGGDFSMAFFTDFTPRGYVGLPRLVHRIRDALFAAVHPGCARRDLPHAEKQKRGLVISSTAARATRGFSGGRLYHCCWSSPSNPPWSGPICSGMRFTTQLGGSDCSWSVPQRSFSSPGWRRGARCGHSSGRTCFSPACWPPGRRRYFRSSCIRRWRPKTHSPFTTLPPGLIRWFTLRFGGRSVSLWRPHISSSSRDNTPARSA